MACSLFSLSTISQVAVVHIPAASRTSSSSSSWSSAVATRCFSANFAGRSDSSVVGGFRSFLNSQWRTMTSDRCDRSSRVIPKAIVSSETDLAETKWGPPVQLATGRIPDDVDLKLFENLLYQWGSSLTQNANLPLPVPLKVDKIEGGVRLGYVRVIDAKCEDVVHIDVVVFPASDEQPRAMFRALRNGRMKDETPPAEPLIMQSLLQALKTAVARSRVQQ